MDIRIISVALVLGIYLSDTIGFVNILFISLGVMLVCIVRIFLKSQVLLIIPISALVFASGAMLYKLSVSDELNKSSEYMSDTVTVTGRICDIPYETEGVIKYIVDARIISDSVSDTSLKERFIIYSSEVFECGDTVSFTGVLKPLPNKMNENGFDTIKYYRSRGITGRMTAEVAGLSDIVITDHSLRAMAVNIRYSIDQLIEKYYSGDRAGILKAILIDNKYEFSDEVNDILTRTATRNLFYPAYIHMMLLTMVVGCVSSSLNRKRRDIITVVILMAYMLLNSERASFIRLFSVSLAVILSRMIFKKVYYPDVFASVVLVNSAINPLLLYDAGYVTSAAGALFIKVFYPYIINKFKMTDISWVKRTVIINLICTIGLLPLTAYYFNSISIYSIITPLVFLPAVIGVIAAAPLFLGLLFVTGSAPLVGQFMTTMTSIMLAVPKVIDKLPFSRIFIKAPSVIFLIVCILIAVAAAYAIKKKIRHVKILLTTAAVLFLICGIRTVSRINTVEVDFVNVGQGDGAVITVPFGANLLIDGGGGGEYSDYDIGARVFLPYLTEKGITTVDAAFVSHYHKDHIQGISAALDNIKVKNLFMPDSLEGNEWRTELENKAMEHGVKIWYVKDNTKVTFNDGLTVDITVPDSSTKFSGDENDTSLMINVSYGEFNCLFTGDMTTLAEKNLLNKGKVPEAEVLKVAHHGSGKSTCDEFFNAVSPDYAVISLGEDNIYKFPNEALLSRIQSAQILRTDLNGDIRIISDKDGNIKVDTFK